MWCSTAAFILNVHIINVLYEISLCVNSFVTEAVLMVPLTVCLVYAFLASVVLHQTPNGVSTIFLKNLCEWILIKLLM